MVEMLKSNQGVVYAFNYSIKLDLIQVNTAISLLLFTTINLRLRGEE